MDTPTRVARARARAQLAPAPSRELRAQAYRASLVKGAGHKYVRRTPNPNAPPKWRYDYQHRNFNGRGSAEKVDAVSRRHITEGAKVADGKGAGHWEVRELEGGGVELVHDETGERKAFDNAYSAARHLNEAHAPLTSEATKARRARRVRECKIAARQAAQAHRDFEKAPSVKGLRKCAAGWAAALNLARAGALDWEDLYRWFPSTVEPPASPAELGRELAELRAEIALFGSARPWSASEVLQHRHPDRIKKAVRFRYLYRLADGLGGAWQQDTQAEDRHNRWPPAWNGKYLRGTWDGVPSLARSVTKPPTARKVAAALRGSNAAKDIGRNTWIVVGANFEKLPDDATDHEREVARLARELMAQHKGYIAGVDVSESLPTGEYELGAAARALHIDSTVPVEKMRPEALAPPAPVTLAALFETAQEKRRTLGVDDTPLEWPPGADPQMAVGELIGARGMVTMPTSMAIAALNAGRAQAAEQVRAKHAQSWAPVQAKIAAALAAVGELPGTKADHLTDALIEQTGLSRAEVATAAAYAKAETRVVAGRVGRLEGEASEVYSKLYHGEMKEAGAAVEEALTEDHEWMLKQDPVATLWMVAPMLKTDNGGPLSKALGPEIAQRATAAYDAGLAARDREVKARKASREARVGPSEARKVWAEWFPGEKMPKPEAWRLDGAQADALGLDAAAMREVRRRVREKASSEDLAHIREALGIKGDPAAGLASLDTGTPEQVRASWRTGAGVKKTPEEFRAEPLDRFQSYDTQTDPGRLAHLFANVAQSVVPRNVRIDLYRGEFRAHAGHEGIIRQDMGPAGAVNARTLWHEYGHQIEFGNKAIGAATKAMLRERCAGESATHLGAGYEAYEVAYEDEFASRYTAKHYDHVGTSEVLSMGIDAYLHDPAELQRDDPMLFGFVLAVVSGAFGPATGHFKARS